MHLFVIICYLLEMPDGATLCKGGHERFKLKSRLLLRMNNYNKFNKIYIIRSIGKKISITKWIVICNKPKQEPRAMNVFIAGTQCSNRRFRMDTVDGIRLWEFSHLGTRLAVQWSSLLLWSNPLLQACHDEIGWTFSIMILKYTQVGVTCPRNLPLMMYSWKYWGEYARFFFCVQKQRRQTLDR